MPPLTKEIQRSLVYRLNGMRVKENPAYEKIGNDVAGGQAVWLDLRRRIQGLKKNQGGGKKKGGSCRLRKW